MSLVRLSLDQRVHAVDLVSESCNEEELELILSQEGVYLGFQRELLELHSTQRIARTAELVVLLLGDGLLRNPVARSLLCKATGTPEPKSWRPGSIAASRLASTLGLPAVFAGTQPLPPSPLVERLAAQPVLPQLMDYQEEVLEKALGVFPGSCLVSLPTGGGKTRVGTELVTRHLIENDKGTRSALWLAHTEELCEQATQCITEVWNSTAGGLSAALFRAWGRNTQRLSSGEMFQAADMFGPDRQEYQIVVSTPQSALSLLKAGHSPGALGSALSGLSLVIVDEAHRAAAPTYRNLLGTLASGNNPAPSVIGLSATPVRETYASDRFKGTKDLAALFRELIEPTETLGTSVSPVSALQHRGVLAELRIHQLPVAPGDSRELASQIVKSRRGAVSPAITFVPTASEAKVLAAYLSESGTRSEAVTSKTPPTDRMVLVEALKAGHLDVLCNCELLTTGFDAPRISQIFLARQTDSPVLYKQMVGRGLRGPRMGGSESCDLYLCGVNLSFEADPNTSAFARSVWQSKS